MADQPIPRRTRAVSQRVSRQVADRWLCGLRIVGASAEGFDFGGLLGPRAPWLSRSVGREQAGGVVCSADRVVVCRGEETAPIPPRRRRSDVAASGPGLAEPTGIGTITSSDEVGAGTHAAARSVGPSHRLYADPLGGAAALCGRRRAGDRQR